MDDNSFGNCRGRTVKCSSEVRSRSGSGSGSPSFDKSSNSSQPKRGSWTEGIIDTARGIFSDSVTMEDQLDPTETSDECESLDDAQSNSLRSLKNEEDETIAQMEENIRDNKELSSSALTHSLEHLQLAPRQTVEEESNAQKTLPGEADQTGPTNHKIPEGKPAQKEEMTMLPHSNVQQTLPGAADQTEPTSPKILEGKPAQKEEVTMMPQSNAQQILLPEDDQPVPTRHKTPEGKAQQKEEMSVVSQNNAQQTLPGEADQTGPNRHKTPEGKPQQKEEMTMLPQSIPQQIFPTEADQLVPTPHNVPEGKLSQKEKMNVVPQTKAQQNLPLEADEAVPTIHKTPSQKEEMSVVSQTKPQQIQPVKADPQILTRQNGSEEKPAQKEKTRVLPQKQKIKAEQPPSTTLKGPRPVQKQVQEEKQMKKKAEQSPKCTQFIESANDCPQPLQHSPTGQSQKTYQQKQQQDQQNLQQKAPVPPSTDGKTNKAKLFQRTRSREKQQTASDTMTLPQLTVGVLHQRIRARKNLDSKTLQKRAKELQDSQPCVHGQRNDNAAPKRQASARNLLSAPSFTFRKKNKDKIDLCRQAGFSRGPSYEDSGVASKHPAYKEKQGSSGDTAKSETLRAAPSPESYLPQPLSTTNKSSGSKAAGMKEKTSAAKPLPASISTPRKIVSKSGDSAAPPQVATTKAPSLKSVSLSKSSGPNKVTAKATKSAKPTPPKYEATGSTAKPSDTKLSSTVEMASLTNNTSTRMVKPGANASNNTTIGERRSSNNENGSSDLVDMEVNSVTIPDSTSLTVVKSTAYAPRRRTSLQREASTKSSASQKGASSKRPYLPVDRMRSSRSLMTDSNRGGSVRSLNRSKSLKDTACGC